MLKGAGGVCALISNALFQRAASPDLLLRSPLSLGRWEAEIADNGAVASVFRCGFYLRRVLMPFVSEGFLLRRRRTGNELRQSPRDDTGPSSL